jgi:hypothetical protein
VTTIRTQGQILFVSRLLLISGALVATASCATREEWRIWSSHGTHFASLDHLLFSARNQEEAATRVTRPDIATAREEGWWGERVTVSQEEILER